MPISLNHLKNDKRTIQAVYFNDAFSLTYRPSELTPAVEAGIRESEDNNILVNTLCNLITDWEVQDETGEPVAIEPDVLNNMPSAFLGAILQACREDMLPKPMKGKR